MDFCLSTRKINFKLHLFCMSKVEHLSICLRTIHISSFKTFYCYLLSIFPIRLLVFFPTFRSSFCISNIRFLSVFIMLQISSLVCHLSCTLLLQICFNFMYLNLSISSLLYFESWLVKLCVFSSNEDIHSFSPHVVLFPVLTSLAYLEFPGIYYKE